MHDEVSGRYEQILGLLRKVNEQSQSKSLESWGRCLDVSNGSIGHVSVASIRVIKPQRLNAIVHD